MKIESIQLKNFRNIDSIEVIPNSKINLIFGNNGQGKTSFIEGIDYLFSLRSFRSAKTSELLQNSKLESLLECKLKYEDKNVQNWSSHLKVELERFNEEDRVFKSAYINEKKLPSSTEYLTQRWKPHQKGFHAITFHPMDHQLITGGPNLRRQYLNKVIASEQIEELKIQKKFNRILDQRNSLLKSKNYSKAQLDVFTEPLVETGSKITLSRLKWLAKLQKKVNKIMEKIAPEQEILKINYFSKWFLENEVFIKKNNKLSSDDFTGQYDLTSLEKLKEDYRLKLSESIYIEKKLQVSLVGPHRDDLVINLGNKKLKDQGSQGEIRSTLLGIKLSEIELFKEETNINPVLLLDDISSELDNKRRRFLFNYLENSNLQVFITTTEQLELSGKKFWVNKGNINEHKL